MASSVGAQLFFLSICLPLKPMMIYSNRFYIRDKWPQTPPFIKNKRSVERLVGHHWWRWPPGNNIAIISLAEMSCSFYLLAPSSLSFIQYPHQMSQIAASQLQATTDRMFIRGGHSVMRSPTVCHWWHSVCPSQSPSPYHCNVYSNPDDRPLECYNISFISALKLNHLLPLYVLHCFGLILLRSPIRN